MNPESVDNSAWFTFRVGPYVLIQIITNCSGYVKCKLHTLHHWQGTSWIVPGWGEIRCPFSAQQRNARDWGEVAEGLRACDAPRLLAPQINYKLELGPCSFSLPSFGIVRCLPAGEGKAETMDNRGLGEVRENEVVGRRVTVWPRVAKVTLLTLAELFWKEWVGH